MAIGNKQIGWSNEANLLWDLSMKLERLIQVAGPTIGTTTTTTTSTTTVQIYQVGDYALGGRIAYIFQPGDPGYDSLVQHGLVAALEDLSPAPIWGCTGSVISGADGTALGTGYQNTLDIIAGCSTPGIAAKMCYDLVEGGYSDWYLPSIDELYKLCINRVILGMGMASNISSTENGADFAKSIYFPFMSIENWEKNNPASVRPVRSF